MPERPASLMIIREAGLHACDSDLVEVLGNYSKHGHRGKSTISVIDDAIRCRQEAADRETPSGTRTAPRERARTLTAPEIDELVVAYQGGESTYALSRRLGVHRSTVAAHLERRGVMRRARGHRGDTPRATGNAT